ncbi:MAG: signal recognition particle-docking protein FtsY [Melioribacteraceae bacterium]|nr:signal recognition particle-docking protein FtsY [Melioribacteraceae bacterium]
MSLLKNFNFDKLKNGLSKTRNNIIGKITEVFSGKVKFNNSTIDEIEEILLSADIGSKTTENIIDKIRKMAIDESDRSISKIKELIMGELKNIIGSAQSTPLQIIDSNKPFIILIVGVNGSGKTTSIAKLANIFRKSGYSVMIASADTFRAAANEQLETWAKRVDVPVFTTTSKDPSAVVFDALNFSIKNETDILIIDTAGRLHTQKNLMEELSKIKRVIKSLKSNGIDEILLVIDGTAGQNALLQAKEFSKYTDLTGLILTKLDGTAKGGIVFQICSELQIPLRYIGVGEEVEDLQNLEPSDFVKAIFN